VQPPPPPPPHVHCPIPPLPRHPHRPLQQQSVERSHPRRDGAQQHGSLLSLYKQNMCSVCIYSQRVGVKQLVAISSIWD